MVVLVLTSLMVIAGIVTAASRGVLFRATNRWGAITLTSWMSFYWIFYWYSARRPIRNAIVWWLILPVLALSASRWLMAVAG